MNDATLMLLVLFGLVVSAGILVYAVVKMGGPPPPVKDESKD